MMKDWLEFFKTIYDISLVKCTSVACPSIVQLSHASPSVAPPYRRTQVDVEERRLMLMLRPVFRSRLSKPNLISLSNLILILIETIRQLKIKVLRGQTCIYLRVLVPECYYNNLDCTKWEQTCSESVKFFKLLPLSLDYLRKFLNTDVSALDS